MIKRLRNKFVLINMTIVTVMLLVIFSLIIFFMGMAMEIQGEQMMQDIVENTFRFDRRESQRGGRRHEAWRPHLVVHMDTQGNIVATNSNFTDTLDEQAVLEYAQAALAAEGNSGTLKAYALRFRKIEDPFGKCVVFVDISNELATMKNLIQTCLFISVLSFSLFLVISFLLAKWAVGPVEKAWNQQRQFVADASHELKTPLTVIMTNAELLQSPEYAESERSRFAGSILTMSHQMRGLVESLLELARVDNGTTKMVFSLLDISEVVSDSLLPFEPVYFEKELQLESHVESELYVKGSASHLRQVVDILLDNAAKYSAPNGTVTVRLKRQGNYCLLSVANPGEAISREDLKNIFKRFYRIDKARAMNHSYGLGLAIADSVVSEHGGKIWAESENGVNTFFVQLPAL